MTQDKYLELLLKSTRPDASIGDFADVKSELVQKLKLHEDNWKFGAWKSRRGKHEFTLDNMSFIKECDLGIPTEPDEIWEFMSANGYKEIFKNVFNWEQEYESGIMSAIKWMYLGY